MAEEVLHWLVRRPSARYLDCTLGQGGLAARLLERGGSETTVIGIDRDREAIEAARLRLQPYADRIRLVHGHFAELKRHLASLQVEHVDGVVFDLGLSSAQLSRPERGFSFLADGPLDMRMDRSHGPTAADLVNSLPERALADLIYEFGEERYSRRIARGIAQARAKSPLRTTFQLVAVIQDAVPGRYRHGRLHCATRTFQALRVAVNEELAALEPAFRAAADMLAPGGRLCIISFHSLEDRIAKQTIKALSQEPASLLRPLTKKPLTPLDAECRANPRARSAKLRVAERRCP
jgi:16S rRNA (cytosine1402-N4)-methyltransferase